MLPLWSFVLALAAAAVPASAAALPGSGQVVRIDDVAVLNGTLIQIDPIGGLNETTSNPEWQEKYWNTLDLKKVDSIYRKQLELDSVSQHGDDQVGVLDKRSPRPICVRETPISYYPKTTHSLINKKLSARVHGLAPCTRPRLFAD